MENAGYELERLYTDVTSLCGRIELLPCRTARDRLAQSGDNFRIIQFKGGGAQKGQQLFPPNNLSLDWLKLEEQDNMKVWSLKWCGWLSVTSLPSDDIRAEPHELISGTCDIIMSDTKLLLWLILSPSLLPSPSLSLFPPSSLLPPSVQKWRSVFPTSCVRCWVCSRVTLRPTPSASRSPSWRHTSPASQCRRTTRWRSCEASRSRTFDSSSSANESTERVMSVWSVPDDAERNLPSVSGRRLFELLQFF